VGGVAAVAFGAWLISGFYLVQPSERAVIFTFGAVGKNDWAGPGLHYHVPMPIQHVEKVAVTTLNFADVGGAANADAPAESLMLTGDEQIIDLDFRVTWRIDDPAKYLFAVRDPDKAVKAVAESAMREVVGKTPLQPIISTGRGAVQQQTKVLMQHTLDSWGAGIEVVEVQIRQAQPPPEVIAAFRDVNNAQQDADSAVNEANTYRNRVINEAKGDAAAITQQAEAYRERATREAIGDAARFNALYAEYRRAPGVTRDRIYIETMEQVLRASNKVVIDAKGATAPIILPPDVFRPKAQTGAPQIEVGPAQATPPKGGGQ
jgi:membrane protease subunit HflK